VNIISTYLCRELVEVRVHSVTESVSEPVFERVT